jgi:hypothetical protein
MVRLPRGDGQTLGCDISETSTTAGVPGGTAGMGLPAADVRPRVGGIRGEFVDRAVADREAEIA